MFRCGILQSFLAPLAALIPLALTGPAAPQAQNPCAGSGERSVHVVVVDCTDSMDGSLPSRLKQGASSFKSKWAFVVAECLRIIDEAPDGQELIFMPFGHNYDGCIGLKRQGIPEQNAFEMPRDKAKARTFVGSLKDSEKSTAYRLARFRGLTVAKAKCTESSAPTRLTVLTDGEDNNSPNAPPEVINAVAFGDLATNFLSLNPENQIRLVLLMDGEQKGEFGFERESSPAFAATASQQKFPALAERGQKFTLCLSLAPFSPKLPAGTQLDLSCAGGSLCNANIALTPSSVTVPPEGGAIAVELRMSPFDARLAAQGGDLLLRLSSSTPGVTCLTESIPLQFAPEDRVSAGPILPAPRKVGLGKELKFDVKRAPDTSIKWTVRRPNGSDASPADGTVKFDQVGPWTVSATVSKGSLTPAVPAPVQIECIDTNLKLTATGTSIQGSPVTVECASSTPLTGITWLDQPPDEGAMAEVGPGTRWKAHFTFARAGKQRIRVTGSDRDGTPGIGAEITLDVTPRPTIEITSPSNGDMFDAGEGRSIEVIARSVENARNPGFRLLALVNGKEVAITKDPSTLAPLRKKDGDGDVPFTGKTAPDLGELVANAGPNAVVEIQLVAELSGVQGAERSRPISVRLTKPTLQLQAVAPSAANPVLTLPGGDAGGSLEFGVEANGSLLKEAGSIRFTKQGAGNPTVTSVPMPEVTKPPFEARNLQRLNIKFDRADEQTGKPIMVTAQALGKSGQPIGQPVTWQVTVQLPPPAFKVDASPLDFELTKSVTVDATGIEPGDAVDFPEVAGATRERVSDARCKYTFSKEFNGRIQVAFRRNGKTVVKETPLLNAHLPPFNAKLQLSRRELKSGLKTPVTATVTGLSGTETVVFDEVAGAKMSQSGNQATYTFSRPFSGKITATVTRPGDAPRPLYEPIEMTVLEARGGLKKPEGTVYGDQPTLDIVMPVHELNDASEWLLRARSDGRADDPISLGEGRSSQTLKLAGHHGNLMIELVARYPDGTERVADQLSIAILIRELGSASVEGGPGVVRPFGSRSVPVRTMAKHAQQTHLYARKDWQHASGASSRPSREEIRQAVLACAGDQVGIDRFMQSRGFERFDGDLTLVEKELCNEAGEPLESGEVVLIGIATAPAQAGGELQVKSAERTIIQKPLGVKQPLFWLGLVAVPMLAFGTYWLLRKNDPLSWTLAADIRWGDEIPLANPLGHDYAIEFGLSRGKARRPSESERADLLTDVNDVVRGWLRLTPLTHKTMRFGMKDLLNALRDIHAKRIFERHLIYGEEAARARSDAFKADFNEGLEAVPGTAQLVLKLDPLDRRFHVPLWEVEGDEHGSLVHPTGGQDMGAAEQIGYRDLPRGAWKPVDLFLSTRTPRNFGQIATIGLMNLSGWLLGPATLAFLGFWVYQYGLVDWLLP